MGEELPKIFEREFEMPYFGIDENGMIKPGQILRFFLETAIGHVKKMGLSTPQLMERGLTWMLKRYRVRFHSLAASDTVVTRTRYRPDRDVTPLRVFEARGASGELIADAWSAWVVVDLSTGRPVMLSRAMPPIFFECVSDGIDNIGLRVKLKPDDWEGERRFRARLSELDMNRHTNNTVYFDWAIESLPDEVTGAMRPSMMDIEYIRGVKREEVTCRVKKLADAPARYAHRIETAGGDEAARMETEWTPI